MVTVPARPRLISCHIPQAIELARYNPQSCMVTLHPGTVDTELSRPFQKMVPNWRAVYRRTKRRTFMAGDGSFNAIANRRFFCV
jgi:hypothetical protein